MKTVIIGAGRMGRRHVLAAKAAGLEVAGISDLLESSLAEAHKEGMPQSACFTDTRQMLRSVQAPVVIVSTTGPSHAELVHMAVEHGARYILCEKPLAVSIAQAKQMIAACAAKGVRLGVNHQMRYMEQYTAVKKLAFSPELGGIASINVLAGNMGMAMNGTHYFEMYRYMTGSPATTVQAWFSKEDLPNPRGPQFADKAGQILLLNATGQRFYMDIGPDQGHGLVVSYGCRYGHIVVDELEGHMSVTHRQAEHRELPTTRYGMPWTRSETRIVPADAVAPTSAVLKALIEGKDWPDGACGLMTLQTLVAAYVSDEQGHTPVAVDSGLPESRVFPWA